MICYLLSSLLNNFIASPPFISSKYRCSPQQILYKLLDGYRSPSTLHTSCTNFVNQKFKERAFISVMHVSKLSTVSKSTWKPASSSLAYFIFLEFCHSLNIFTAHFVWYLVDFGTLLAKQSSSSCLVFGCRNSRFELISSKTTATSLQALENASAWFRFYNI